MKQAIEDIRLEDFGKMYAINKLIQLYINKVRPEEIEALLAGLSQEYKSDEDYKRKKDMKDFVI